MTNNQIITSLLEFSDQAKVLSEALPYLRLFSGETIVIKFGGHAMGTSQLTNFFARDITLLRQVGINPIIVHGGGPQIQAMLEKLKIKSDFINGLRVTTKEIMEVVEMVLVGSINKTIVSAVNAAGGRATGLCGKDCNLIQVEKLIVNKNANNSAPLIDADLGFVGKPSFIDPFILESLLSDGIIPIIAPVGFDKDQNTFNINADTAAGAIAGALKASRLYMLTDVPGILDQKGNLLSELSTHEANKLIRSGEITGGMIPKTSTCIEAIEAGVQRAAILDGRIQHSLLIELFTKGGAGTLITA